MTDSHKSYVLSCCSTADLSKDHFEKRSIHFICFHFFLNGTEYDDDLGQSVPFDQFYKAMAQGASTRTSQCNVEEYVAYFRPFLEDGKDILHVTLSSGISGTYNSACAARDKLAEEFPDRKIYIVDSLGASSGYGLLMDKMADLRDEGWTIDQLYQWVLTNRLKVHHWFFSTDLTYYVRGGRISKASGMFGTLLRICPLLNMNDKGLLIPREKIRTKKAVIQRIVEKMKTYADNRLDYSGKCYISESDCMADAHTVAMLVEQTFPHLDGKVEINSVGTVIGSHTGPGTIALFFFGDKRNN